MFTALLLGQCLVQEDYNPEEDDDVPTTSGNDAKSFFSTAEGVTYHANSFLDLHLSRPLLRACESLGYAKPTPIQVLCHDLVFFFFLDNCWLVMWFSNCRIDVFPFIHRLLVYHWR